MKKLKRISLVSGVQILDSLAQKQLRGAGDVDPNVCHSKSTRYSCSGSCVDYQGHSGSCYWVGVESSCKCGVAFVG
ncbi:MAG: hypothetical protein AUK63_1796 [bacterium P3]|nr:MAG: hypothetical protein AUK63_1796 [bacterium P3]KWW38616.1 MAG: hypothetical protein F083_2205 [bacterium F083]